MESGLLKGIPVRMRLMNQLLFWCERMKQVSGSSVRTLSMGAILFSVLFPFVTSMNVVKAGEKRGEVVERAAFGADDSLAPRFRTFYVTWGATEKPEFARYLEEVRPDVVQAGWYGPMFFGYVGSKQSTGYPMQLPASGLAKCWEEWRTLHEKVRAAGGKSVAHFTVTNVIRGPEKDDGTQPGFFADWYTQDWPEDLLGKRPTSDWRDLVSKDASGNVLIDKHYVQYNALCVNNPATRTVLKRMVRAGITNGVDGFMTTYNYRRACACEHCQTSFKSFLERHYTSEELRRHFGIETLSKFQFEKIPGQTPGYPGETDLNPLGLASFQWSAIAFKAAWDDVFLGEGRSVKPDLVLGQWDHLGNVGVTEERGFLPIDQFAKGENYLWYSGNHYSADVKPGDDNDGWLNGLYLRALAGEKPYVIGRYDGVRLRVGQAESMALGGAGTGLYNAVTDPASFNQLKRYSSFAKAHEHDVLDRHVRASTKGSVADDSSTMLADTCLVIPRQAAWAGKRRSFDTFRRVGTELVRRQQRLMMLSDEVLGVGMEVGGAEQSSKGSAHRKDLLNGGGLKPFRVVILPEVVALSDEQVSALQRWMALREDNRLVIIGDAATLDSRGRPWAIAEPVDGEKRMDWTRKYSSQRVVRVGLEALENAGFDWSVMRPLSQGALDLWVERGGARIPLKEANSIRVALYRQTDGSHVLHLVNYERDVARAKSVKRANPDAELPIASEPVWVRIPKAGSIAGASSRVFTPDVREDGTPEVIEHADTKDDAGDRWIRVGSVSVYRVLEIR